MKEVVLQRERVKQESGRMTQRSAENYQKEAKQVVKSESLWSTFKGALDVREERQTMIWKHGQGPRKTATPYQAFIFASVSFLSLQLGHRQNL